MYKNLTQFCVLTEEIMLMELNGCDGLSMFIQSVVYIAYNPAVDGRLVTVDRLLNNII